MDNKENMINLSDDDLDKVSGGDLGNAEPHDTKNIDDYTKSNKSDRN